MQPETNFVCDRCGAFCHDDLGRPIQFGEANIAALLALPQVITRCLLCRRDHGPWETDSKLKTQNPKIGDSQLPPSDR
jgi:hypothetical protein